MTIKKVIKYLTGRLVLLFLLLMFLRDEIRTFGIEIILIYVTIIILIFSLCTAMISRFMLRCGINIAGLREDRKKTQKT